MRDASLRGPSPSNSLPPLSSAPDTELPRAELVGARPRFLDTRAGRALEVAGVVLVVLAIFLPGLSRYSLVDPWETHYAEVGRRMLQDDDLVHTKWQNEGFRSKPVLTMWLIAGGIRLAGHGEAGGYSGDMVSSTAVVFGARLPFVLFGVLGLVLTWWVLARLVRRRLAWLALLVIGTCPFYFLIARQAITDMPLVGCLMGAFACFIMAVESGDDALEPIYKRFNAYHLFLAAVGAFVGWQAIYYAVYFARDPYLAHAVRFPAPHIILPGMMAAAAALFVFWAPLFRLITRSASWLWAPATTRRQLYMFWFYTLIGVSVLDKGLPGIGIAGAVCLAYVVITGAWSKLSRLEIPRGVILIVLIVVPWHLAMYLKDGRPFVRDYIISHNLKRATAGMHGSRGTFDFVFSQLGIGMWPWVALMPAAAASFVTNLVPRDREGRIRLVFGLWAVVAVALFSMSTTKFHHYIFPAVPALGVMVAFWLDDLLAGKVRRIGALLAVGIVLAALVTRDLMGEHKQLIEMFVYRYDRPWPSGDPWNIDLSDQFLGWGIAVTFMLLLLAVRPIRKVAMGSLAVVTVGFAIWGMNDYMQHAGTHWGMRSAIQGYYQQRHIYGLDIRYYGVRQVADEWDGFDGTLRVRSYIPETFATGQPMTVRIELMKDQRNVMETVELHGLASDYGDDWFEIRLAPAETRKLDNWVHLGKDADPPRTRPWRQVNADRLIAWQLYWRGENFWSGDEIWAEHPDTRTAFKQTDNKAFLEYLKEESRAGQRFFLVTEAGRANNLKNILPSPRAKQTFEILDTSSNKFTLLTFTQ